MFSAHKFAALIAATSCVCASACSEQAPPPPGRPYVITFEEAGTSLCGGKRVLYVENNVVSFPTGGSACAAPLRADGNFSIACSSVGTRPSYKISGTIQDASIVGTYEAQLLFAVAGAPLINCLRHFTGQSR
jgi:hypothetical protein